MPNAVYLPLLLGVPAVFWWFSDWVVALVALLGGFVLTVTANRTYVILQEWRGNTTYSVVKFTLVTLPTSQIIVGLTLIKVRN